MERRFRKAVESYTEEFKRDLAELVACRSVRDPGQGGPACQSSKTGQAQAPFGSGVADAFDVFLRIADRCGFRCRNLQGYACEAQIGERPEDTEYIGILGHLDVVDEGERGLWTSEPFRMTQKGGILYGRGVNDDKGPLLAALYAVRILKDMGMEFQRNVRVIAGGAEETTWECMDYYFRHNSQPVMGFSPDGNFPIVNAEKGILKCALRFPALKGEGGHPEILCDTLENYVCSSVMFITGEGERESRRSFTGRRSLSRNPRRGENALWKLADWMGESSGFPEPAGRFAAFMQECMRDDYCGKKSGLYASDPEMGETSVCPTGALWDEEGICLYLDIRYPKSVTQEELLRRLAELGRRFGFSAAVTAHKRLLYVPRESELIKKLSYAYETVTGERAQAITKGGASYARVLRQGIAFGASFEGEDTHPHMPDECMALSSLQKAMEIYCEAVAALAGTSQELPQ